MVQVSRTRICTAFAIAAVVLIGISRIDAQRPTSRQPPEARPVAQHVETSIPITVTQGKLMLIEALVGPERTQLLLDLGGGLEVLSPKLTAKMSSVRTGHFTGFRMNAERVEIELF